MVMKTKCLYHGSPKKLIGGKLIPKKPIDLGKQKENLYSGIYASDIKEIAIAMAILSCKGVLYSSLDLSQKRKGVIYSGWPKQEYVYLYTLPSEEFRKSKRMSHQFVTQKPVKPIKTEELKIEDYINLVRNATKKE